MGRSHRCRDRHQQRPLIAQWLHPRILYGRGIAVQAFLPYDAVQRNRKRTALIATGLPISLALRMRLALLSEPGIEH
jgi:hypothetical protein